MADHPFENELTVLKHEQSGTMEAFHGKYEEAVSAVLSTLGASHPLRIGGKSIDTDSTFTVTSPGDHEIAIGTFAAGNADHVDKAVATASRTFDEWSTTSYHERADHISTAATELADRKYELAATMTLENGKNRFEAMADVDEAIDFLRFYARELRRNDGYRIDTGEPTPEQHCSNHLRPYGVFGVIAPFNFPLAILAGMTTGAIVTGNTAVVKPASATPLIAHAFLDVLEDIGLPDGVVNLVTGGGRTVGQPLTDHEDVAGVVFTGSRAVGRSIQHTFLESGKSGPVIAELGGKNPVMVAESADLEKAVPGVLFGAFGFSGQKCSATARIYVHESLAEDFTDRLVEETENLVIHPPDHPDALIAPIIDDSALDRYQTICLTAQEVGTVETGGTTVDDPELPDGRYVRPTVVTDVPHDHELAREEHFLPFVTIHPVDSFDDAIDKSNDSSYGLCAGLFSEDQTEVDRWFEEIESGMCYVNRDKSATTGALVQAQPFGGWKASGTTGKFAGGYWYLPQFLREQSRTIVTDE